MAALRSGRRRQLARPAPHSSAGQRRSSALAGRSRAPRGRRRTRPSPPIPPPPRPRGADPLPSAVDQPLRDAPPTSTVPRSGQGSATAPPHLAREPPPWGSSQLSGKTDPAQVREWKEVSPSPVRSCPQPPPPPAGPRGRQISCSNGRQKRMVTVHPLKRKSKLQER